jgi:hypothetical protein
LNSLLDRIPDQQAFFTLSVLRAQAGRLQAKYPHLLTVTPLGQSRSGEPIELLTVAGGKRSALVVAGVHANEPVGSNCAAFLLEQLLGDDRLRSSLDYTWHFVNPIDPDGMRLNEGWFASGPTPREYYRNFFRPALARQPEYTFPLQVEGYTFEASPPENLAFRRAIDLVKPDFLYTTHNADYGGAFFLSSTGGSELDSGLSGLPAEFAVPLSQVGEPLLGEPPRAPGVFALPLPEAIVQKLLTAGKNPAHYWPAGDSSTGYAGTRYGTFCFTAEVPYWYDARVLDHSHSSITLAQALRTLVTEMQVAQEILVRWSVGFTAENVLQPEVFYALQEHNDLQPAKLEQLEAALKGGALDDMESTVSCVALHDVSLRLAMLRPFALLQRLGAERKGKRTLSTSVATELRAYIEHQLDSIWAGTPLRSLPTRSLVGLQVKSGLMAARFADMGNVQDFLTGNIPSQAR